MLRNRVSGALFKSFLRWNRRPEVVASKFALDGTTLGIAKFLPPNATITNAEGLQAAIYHCFRTLDGSPDNIDLGFKVLRDLNSVSQTLSERVSGRESRSKPEVQGIATFRVGQVVQHKKYNIRGVVTGWSLDETKTKQIVEVLPDVVDANELANAPNLSAVAFVDSSLLQLVEDKDLHRIINRDIKTFFDGYDINCRRYMPNLDLKYWYESDLTALESDAITGKNHLPATELKALHKALFRVQNTTVNIGRELQGIVERHTERLRSLSTEDQAVAQLILDEVNKCIQGCVLEGPTTPVPLPGQSFEVGSDLAKEKVTIAPFARKLLRGGVHRSTPNISPLESSATIGVQKSTRKMTSQESERVYYAVGYLGNCYSAVDQLLQLRFQARGIAYHDGLRLRHNDSSTATTEEESRLEEVPSNHLDVAQWNQETTSPAARFKVGQIVKHKKFGYRGVIAGFDQRPSMDMSKWEGILDLELGQEQPIYKIIPDEGDVHHMLNKPEFRASYQVAQENLDLVTERPDFIVRHPYLGTLFQGFDFASGTYRVPPKLQYCFADVLPSIALSESGLVSGTTASTETAPSTTSDASATSGATTVDAAPAATVRPVHRVVDELLVELLTYLRVSMSLTRTNDALYRATQAAPAELDEIPSEDASTGTEIENETDTASGEPLALNMQDLLLLLRSAKCQDHALYIESMLWMVWIAHTTPEINKLVRLSLAHAKRGNVEQAIDVISRAIDFDPTFAEAYNKRASYRHMQQAYDECIEDAQLSLDIFPDHVGALSGLSLCFEQKDKPEQAIKVVRKALELHPWAAHLPTMLISMQTEFIKKAKRGSSNSNKSSSTTTSSTTNSSNSNSAVRDV